MIATRSMKFLSAFSVFFLVACSSDQIVDAGPAICADSAGTSAGVSARDTLFRLADSTGLTVSDREKLAQVRARRSTASTQLIRFHDEGFTLLQSNLPMVIQVSPTRAFRLLRSQSFFNSSGVLIWLGVMTSDLGNGQLNGQAEYFDGTLNVNVTGATAVTYRIDSLSRRLHVVSCVDNRLGS